MVNAENLGAALSAWAEGESSVRALVLIGSRVFTGSAGPLAPDQHSDWDYHVVTTRPGDFADRDWLRALAAGRPLAYVVRAGRFESATKVSAVLPAGALDLVVIPAARLRMASWLLALGLASRIGPVWRGLGDLALVTRAGYRMVKGSGEWGPFYERVATGVPLRRLDDEQLRSLAEGFVCDYVSIRQKIARGELLAAQRWLHLHLAEVNFRLLHELRLRQGEPCAPDARRLEFLIPDRSDVTVRAAPTAEDLNAAAGRCAEGLRRLMHGLVGGAWQWPATLT